MAENHNNSKSIRGRGRKGWILLFLFLFSCSYAIDGLRYLTQESYISGKDALLRIQTAAMIGYGIYQSSRSDASPLSPLLSVMASRIKNNREYLETQVESCEEIVFVSNAVGMDISSQIMAGLFCNLGPGKSPNEM